MGLISMLYVAFASIALFACGHQLIISYKWKGEIIFLSAAWLSLTAFIGYIYLSLCLSPWGISCSPFEMLRTELVLGQLVVISMVWLIFYLLEVPRKIQVIPGTVLFGVLMLFTLFIPDSLLFGENASYRKVSILFDNNLVRLNSEFTVWRAIIHLTIVVLIVNVVIFLIKQKNNRNSKMNFAIISGLILALIAGFFDQLVDMGHINSSLLLPMAIFIYYIILVVLVFYQFIKKMNLQKIHIEKEKMWSDLITHSELILIKLNRMGNVEFCNPYFYKLTGYSENEVIGNDWFELFIPQRSFYDVQGAFLEALNSDFQPQYVNPILDKNRNELIIKWFNLKTTDTEGVVNGSLSVGLNITDETKQNDVLEKKLTEAEKLIASLQSRLPSSPDHG